MRLCTPHMGRQPEKTENGNDPARCVKFPPFVPVVRGDGVGVVVVVPPFAKGEKSDPPKVFREIGGGVIAISPNVCGGIDKPCHVPNHYSSKAKSPQEPWESSKPEKARAQKHIPDQISVLKKEANWVTDQIGNVFGHQLFACNIIPRGEKPKHMRPPWAIKGGVGVTRFIRTGMVDAVAHGPVKGKTLHGQGTRKVGNGFWSGMKPETTMCQHPVIAKCNAYAASEPIEAHHPGQPLPSEEKECRQCACMHEGDDKKINPVDRI